jgi:NAD(P)-dependent dehydrogenase (short-subunit alcohol dehydrogenase family)
LSAFSRQKLTQKGTRRATVKVIVIGASSGLGRCIGTGLGRNGNQVALLARRVDRLTHAVEEAGSGAFALQCDVTDEVACRAAINDAVEKLGGLDGFVYAPGVGPLKKLVDIDTETWRFAFDTNVIGAAIATSAAIPHLAKSAGTAVFLSSVSASHGAPWPGLGAYIVSKAALDKLVEAFRAENPSVGFTRVIVGDTMGGEGESMTEFANAWDQDLAAEVMPIWMTRNYIAGNLFPVEELVGMVDLVLRSGALTSIPSVAVVPRNAQ